MRLSCPRHAHVAAMQIRSATPDLALFYKYALIGYGLSGTEAKILMRRFFSHFRQPLTLLRVSGFFDASSRVVVSRTSFPFVGERGGMADRAKKPTLN